MTENWKTGQIGQMKRSNCGSICARSWYSAPTLPWARSQPQKIKNCRKQPLQPNVNRVRPAWNEWKLANLRWPEPLAVQTIDFTHKPICMAMTLKLFLSELLLQIQSLPTFAFSRLSWLSALCFYIGEVARGLALPEFLFQSIQKHSISTYLMSIARALHEQTFGKPWGTSYVESIAEVSQNNSKRMFQTYYIISSAERPWLQHGWTFYETQTCLFPSAKP